MLPALADYIVLPYFYPIGQLVRKLTVREEKSQYGTRPQRLGMSSLRLICYRVNELAPSGLEQGSDDFNRASIVLTNKAEDI